MMDIKVLSTGRIFRQIDGGVCALLMELFPANIERVNEPAPVRDLSGINGNVQAPRPLAASEWGLATSRVDRNKIIGLQITLAGGEVLTVGGPADKILENCKRGLGGRASLPSDALIKAYAQATGQVDDVAISERVTQQRMKLEDQMRQQNVKSIPDAVAQVVAEAQK